MDKMESVSLFVVTHKNINNLPEDREIIGVGGGNIDGVTLYDDLGDDNISYKNSNYCELTALYWIWKYNNSSIIALEHYRRFFCTNTCLFKPRPLSKKQIVKKLKKYDCVLPYKKYYKKTVSEFYNFYHEQSDLEICYKVISEKYPQYINAYNTIMNRKGCSVYNMFLAKKHIIDSYCQWLFDILFEVEKRIYIFNRNKYQKRVFGFLSERLFNVWLYHNDIKVGYNSVYYPSELPLVRKVKRFLRWLSSFGK